MVAGECFSVDKDILLLAPLAPIMYVFTFLAKCSFLNRNNDIGELDASKRMAGIMVEKIVMIKSLKCFKTK